MLKATSILQNIDVCFQVLISFILLSFNSLLFHEKFELSQKHYLGGLFVKSFVRLLIKLSTFLFLLKSYNMRKTMACIMHRISMFGTHVHLIL